MTELSSTTEHVDYEGFEIHVVPAAVPGSDTRYTDRKSTRLNSSHTT